jgi:CHAT domain-containing protein
MRSADEHLTPQEIEQLLFGADDSKDNAGGSAVPEAQQHLSGCAVCQSLADKYRNVDSALKGLRTDDQRALRASTRGTDCPDDETWPNLAAGLIGEEEATRYVAHAAQCDWCGPLLKESMEDLAQDATAEEQEALDKLPSASVGWQRAMAKKMAAASGDTGVMAVAEVEKPAKSEKPDKSKERVGFGWWPKLVWAGAGLAVVVVAVFVGIRLTRQPDVNALLAEAYTEQRTIELRMPGAKYGPTRITRGKEHSSLNRPASLLDAESIIRHRLDKYPNDPEWLDKKGRAELLDGDYGSAIATLRRAKDLSTAPEIALDLASAYFERAEAEAGSKSNEDYQSALALLNIVLQQNPNDRIGLFNRAIVQERMDLPEAAVKDWDKYLSLSGDDDWKEDARKHLLDMQEKLKKSEEYDRPLMDFSTFARTVSAENTASWQTADARIEDYLEQAVRFWLPTAFSLQEPEPRRNEALQALQVLAVILAQRHNDYWLRDVLGPAHSPSNADAVFVLGEALQAEGAGDPEKAAVKAKEADALFRVAGNRAGSIRARAELVYALHRSVQGHRCEGAAELLEKDLNAISNPWLTAQVFIEHSICAGMAGHLTTSRAEITDALAITKQAAYSQLYLRALGIAASLDTEMGRPDGAWDKDRAGLALFWNGSYSPQRAYQFYSDMGFFPEKSGQWSVALVLAREAAAQAIRTRNPMTEALARFRLASAAAASGARGEAIQEFEAAGKLYERLPQDQTTQIYLLNGQISLAELKTLNGEWDVPLKSLAEAEARVSTVSDYAIPLRLYVVLGEAYSRQARWADARIAYTKAIFISEQALKNLHDGTERLRWNRETQRAYHGLLKCYLRETNDAAGALEFWEWYKAAASRPVAFRDIQVSKNNELLVNVKASAAPVRTLDQIRPSLNKEIIVAYAQFPDEIVSWAFDDRGIRIARVPVSTTEFELTATRFLDQCSDPKSSIDALRSNGRQLYDWLIAPHARYLRADNQITIEPDGQIAKIPFAALVDENGRYLAERFAIAFSPGVHYRNGRPEPAFSPDQKALIVAPPALTSETGLKPLPEAIQEADAVAARFHHPLRLTGSAATLEAVEHALSNSEIFHFVGHSYGNFGSVGLLLVGKDQTRISGPESAILTAERISRLNLHQLRLVVLSSCSTENDPDQVLIDPDELVRAFLQAGAGRVIASRWNADSGATIDLMRAAYGLVAWDSQRPAMYVAGNRLRYANSRSHPFYWAGFYSFGS